MYVRKQSVLHVVDIFKNLCNSVNTLYATCMICAASLILSLRFSCVFLFLLTFFPVQTADVALIMSSSLIAHQSHPVTRDGCEDPSDNTGRHGSLSSLSSV